MPMADRGGNRSGRLEKLLLVIYLDGLGHDHPWEATKVAPRDLPAWVWSCQWLIWEAADLGG